jgi:hypothetical protein
LYRPLKDCSVDRVLGFAFEIICFCHSLLILCLEPETHTCSRANVFLVTLTPTSGNFGTKQSIVPITTDRLYGKLHKALRMGMAVRTPEGNDVVEKEYVDGSLRLVRFQAKSASAPTPQAGSETQ